MIIQKKLAMPSRIKDFPKKLEVLCLAMKKSCKDIAEQADINEKTIDGWKKGATPHKNKFISFCEKIDIDFYCFFDEMEVFCDKIGEKYDVDSTKLKKIIYRDASGELLQTIRSIHAREWMLTQFKEKFEGYWIGMHYWDKGYESEKKHIFCHLFKFYEYDKEKNSIKFYLTSGRLWGMKKKWSYNGHMIISMTKLYLLAETIKKDQVELIVIVATRPYFNSQNILGIILASTPHNEITSSMSKPAASRILLQKIPDEYQEEELLEKYIGIYDENYFNDGLKNILGNIEDKETGVLFPYFDKSRDKNVTIPPFWNIKNE